MMRWPHRLAAFSLTLLVAACAMGPDYETPESSVPPDYSGLASGGPSIAGLDWWTLFDDPRMVELIETALANNLQLAVAMARIEEARASLGFVRADQYPNLNGQAGASRGNALLGTPGTISESFALAADLQFELDLWGKLRRSTEAAQAQLMSSVEARNVVTSALISDVVSLYLLLLDLNARVNIAQDTIYSRRDSLDIIQARFDQGTVPLLDVNQAQIELADALAQRAALIREQAEANHALAVLLGQNPGSLEVDQGSLASALTIPEIPVGLPSELLIRRPDIRQSAYDLHAQTARIGVAEALRYPSISLTGSLGLVSDDLDDFFSSDNKAWGLSINLLGPIFDAGRGKARVEAERALTEQLLSTYQLTVLQALREVEDALVGIETYSDEAGAREFQVEAARSAARLSRARYDGGVSSYLEVLDSERSLFQAELLASVTRRQHVVSIVSLYRALGGGWPTAEEIERAGGFYQAILPPGSDFIQPVTDY